MNGLQPLSNFHTFNVKSRNNNPYMQCLVGQFNNTLDNIILWPSNCYEEKSIVCLNSHYYVNYPFQLLLDPKCKATKDLEVRAKKTELSGLAHKLNKTEAFKSLFSTLWYANLPCFDIKETTAKSNGDRAILKYCEWKGKPIPCSTIFTTFPTDRGMCCSFNMKAADEIFLENTYTNLLKGLQEKDKNSSFTHSTQPSWFNDSKQSITLPG